jgi:GT2 family glycosyltransferase
MARSERIELRPYRDIEQDGDGPVAIGAEPWLTLSGFDLAPYAGHFVTMTYRASAWDEPARPLIRFVRSEGAPIDRIAAAPVAGAGLWTGRVPSDTIRIDISPTNRLGRFDFRAERIETRPWPMLVAQGFRRYPRQARSALLTRLIGWTPESDVNLAWAIGGTPFAAFDAWRRLRRRPLELDGIDRPRFDWTLAPPVRVLIRAGHDRHSLRETLASLTAQVFGGWTARVLTGGKPVETDDSRIASSDADGAWAEVGEDALICILDAGDRLDPTALAVAIERAHHEPNALILYGDEVIVGANGPEPVLKPGWCPQLHDSLPYLGHSLFVRGAGAWSLDDRRAFLSSGTIPSWIARGAGLIRPLRRLLLERPAGDRASTAPAIGPTPELMPDHRARATIVIPTRDHPVLLRRVIASIRARSRPGSFHLVVVDNGSVSAESTAHIAELRQDPDVSILDYPGPFNFSAMCNVAAATTTDPLLVFLNDDTEVLSDGWLDRLQAYALDPSTGCVGARLTYPDGRLQHVGVLVGMGESAGHFGSLAPGDDPGWAARNTRAHEVSAVTGACLAVAREKFDAVGGFDAEELPVELSDIDLCLKLNARGWQTIVDPAIHLMHEESVSRGGATLRRLDVYGRQRTVFIERWRAVLRDDPTFHPGLSLYRWEAALG